MLDKLEITRYRFVLAPLEPISLPPFKGSALRGAFGHAFKRMVCLQHGAHCNSCQESARCAYSYVFETPAPPDSQVLRTHEAVPRPFVFEPPLDSRLDYAPGDNLVFNLVLIGRAIEYLPCFVLAFKELGAEGLGRQRGQFRLQQVWAQDPLGPWETLIYDGPTDSFRNAEMNASIDDVQRAASRLPEQDLVVRFLTPTCLKSKGRIAQQPPFHVLIRALLRRMSSLSYFHCGERWDTDYKGLIEQAQQVETTQAEVSWQDWKRYSSRQNQWIGAGGMVGWLRFAGPLSGYRFLLVLGTIVHVGKGCVFGNGLYRIEEPFAKGHISAAV